MYTFNEINIDTIDITEFNSTPNKSIFTSIPWIKFLIEDNPNARLLILRIIQDENFIGYFTGMLTEKFGIKILGSPFPGWSTCFMGFDLIDDRIIPKVLLELKDFVFQNYRVKYLNIIDRNLQITDDSLKKAKISKVSTLELDIFREDNELFKNFKSDCRTFIRQFEKRGGVLKIVEPNAKFASEFYAQLVDVFKKQGMVPTYSEKKVECLVRNLGEADMVLCLQVYDIEGSCIASSIFPGFGNKCYYWGGASYQSTQHYRPNEYMIWTAIKYWRDKGIRVMDMMGVRDYKKKFAPNVVLYNQVEFSQSKALLLAKDIAKQIYFSSLHIKEKFSLGEGRK